MLFRLSQFLAGHHSSCYQLSPPSQFNLRVANLVKNEEKNGPASFVVVLLVLAKSTMAKISNSKNKKNTFI